LISFYNKTRYAAPAPNISSPEPSHKRSNSTSATTLEDPALIPFQIGSSAIQSDSDVFPPRRTDINTSSDVEFWLHEYEDVLGEVFGEGKEYVDGVQPDLGGGVGGVGGMKRDDVVWKKLGQIMRGRKGSELSEEEEISDSESVVSIGELGEGARLDDTGLREDVGSGEVEGVFARQQESVEGDKNTWEVGIFILEGIEV
jgi:hypothetical protein